MHLSKPPVDKPLGHHNLGKTLIFMACSSLFLFYIPMWPTTQQLILQSKKST